jgi:hypothetical protein
MRADVLEVHRGSITRGRSFAVIRRAVGRVDGARAVIHRVLADLILIAHLGFIVFVVLGGLLTLRWRGAPFVHLPAVAWGVHVEWSGGICPLTPLENSLRQAAGGAGYSGGFIEHYLVPILYPSNLSPPVQLALAAFVILANVVVYLAVWRRVEPTA